MKRTLYEKLNYDMLTYAKPLIRAVAISMLVIPSVVVATPFYDNYNFNPVLSPTAAEGVYYTDRYNPAVFESAVFNEDNRLHVEVNSADSALSRPGAFSSTFYNTQGRAYDNSGAKFIQADLFISNDWGNVAERRADFWGVAVDVSNTVSAYPIIGATNIGGVLRFRVFLQDTGLWSDLATPISTDTWYTLAIMQKNDELLYFINGSLVYTDATVTNSVSLKSSIIQAYNFGQTYDVYWDNFKVDAEKISGSVILKDEGNIVVNPGSSIQGILASLFDVNDELIDAKLTDENGNFVFPAVAAGSYYIQYTAPAGFVFENNSNIFKSSQQVINIEGNDTTLNPVSFSPLNPISDCKGTSNVVAQNRISDNLKAFVSRVHGAISLQRRFRNCRNLSVRSSAKLVKHAYDLYLSASQTALLGLPSNNDANKLGCTCNMQVNSFTVGSISSNVTDIRDLLRSPLNNRCVKNRRNPRSLKRALKKFELATTTTYNTTVADIEKFPAQSEQCS